MDKRIIISDDFAEGFAKWEAFGRQYFRTPRATIVPAPTDQAGLSGNVLHIPYDLAVKTAGAHAGTFGDCNRFVQVNLKDQQLRHFLVAGRFSLAHREGDVLTGQRKLFYLWGTPISVAKGGWHIVVSAWGGADLLPNGQKRPIMLEVATTPYARNRGGAGKVNAAVNLQYNRAYDLELRVHLNSRGVRDGTIELLLDGVTVLFVAELGWSEEASPLSICRIGAQVNAGRHVPGTPDFRHEDRYWDRIEIAELGASA